MHSDNKLLFVAGLGSTGSSAVCDLISGYDEVFCPSQEWRLWVDPDGLVDLAQKLSYESSLFWQSTSIDRFDKLVRHLIKPRFGPYSKLRLPDYVREIYRQISQDIHSSFNTESYPGIWYGNSNHLYATANFRFKRKFWKSPTINKKMWIASMLPEQEALKKIGLIVDRVLENYLDSKSANLFAVNENFSILFADSILKMHPNAKIVVVLRNSLDVYADSLRVGWLAMPYKIEQFARWQNEMFKQVERIKAIRPEQIHIVWFEDLCENYELELSRLKEFIPGKLNKLNERKFFPEKSIKNIGQWESKAPWLSEYSHLFEFDRLKGR